MAVRAGLMVVDLRSTEKGAMGALATPVAQAFSRARPFAPMALWTAVRSGFASQREVSRAYDG